MFSFNPLGSSYVILIDFYKIEYGISILGLVDNHNLKKAWSFSYYKLLTNYSIKPIIFYARWQLGLVHNDNTIDNDVDDWDGLTHDCNNAIPHRMTQLKSRIVLTGLSGVSPRASGLRPNCRAPDSWEAEIENGKEQDWLTNEFQLGLGQDNCALIPSCAK